MNWRIGHGSLLSFILAYGWGILLFAALAGGLGVGLYWIFAAVADKVRRETGVARVKTIAWAAFYVVTIGFISLGLLIQFGKKH